MRDVAIGESHAIALTTDGCIYIVGDNGNGQLGLGPQSAERVETWTKLDVPFAQGSDIVGVVAGPRASFIIVKR